MTADRWDADLPDFVWQARAWLHTRLRWRRRDDFDLYAATRESIWEGTLDGPAALGPFAGSGLLCQAIPARHLIGGPVAWEMALDVIAGAGWRFRFRVGPLRDPALWPALDGAKQAFQDIAIGSRPDDYRVASHGKDPGRWRPLRRAPEMIQAAKERRGATDVPFVVERGGEPYIQSAMLRPPACADGGMPSGRAGPAGRSVERAFRKNRSERKVG